MNYPSGEVMKSLKSPNWMGYVMLVRIWAHLVDTEYVKGLQPRDEAYDAIDDAMTLCEDIIDDWNGVGDGIYS